MDNHTTDPNIYTFIPYIYIAVTSAKKGRYDRNQINHNRAVGVVSILFWRRPINGNAREGITLSRTSKTKDRTVGVTIPFFNLCNRLGRTVSSPTVCRSDGGRGEMELYTGCRACREGRCGCGTKQKSTERIPCFLFCLVWLRWVACATYRFRVGDYTASTVTLIQPYEL